VKWIKTSEQLPQDGQEVFCFWQPYDVYDAPVSGVNYGVALYYKRSWCDVENGNDDYYTPMYWAALPDRPDQEPSQ